MVAIRIEERAQNEFNAVVSFDGSGDYPVKIADPFSPEEEACLEWYFEEHLRFPFTDQVKAREAGESLKAYGEGLFSQVFADRDAFAEYRTAARQGLDRLHIEIVGSPEFHHPHWEALKDPDLPKPLCLYAPMVRRSREPQTYPAGAAPSPTINLLVVTARPHVERDVGYRTITRPLVEALRAARLPVDIDIVRPGTYRALSEHLKHKGAGFYHVVHFDLHGALLSHEKFQKAGQAEQFVFRARYDRPDLPAYGGEKAFLFFEDESAAPHGGDDTKRRADPAEASEVAERLLLPYRIPIVILNACQSGKQTGDAETSLAARLMQAGVQTVLGMAYSVTVSAAKTMMPKLYGALSEGEPLDRAILAARGELEAIKIRRAYYNQQIALEDWLLPVVYQHKASPLALSEFTPQQREAWLREKQAQYRPRQPTYGFFGRDVDILRIEKRLLGADGGNILLVRGMGGAGKSTLLHHLGAWWQQTGLLDRVFYFGWDEKAWTRQQILHAIAGTLYDAGRFHGSFLPLGEDLQQEDVAETLRGGGHLLILDNLESITGSPLAVPNALSPEEQGKLRAFLSRLRGGRTLVLFGSRGGEDWLAPATFGVNVHTLQGLDAEAASDLAERVLVRHGATARRKEPKFRDLMTLLAGYPLALEVVLANLKTRSPTEVLAALEEGAAGLDAGGADKTENILHCIEYSHGNLSAEAQGLLACLAPFTGVIFQPMLDTYAQQLRAQPPLAHLPFGHWQAVLKEAIDWGLLTADPDVPGFLRIQPVLPYFLRQHLSEPARAAEREAIETAFRQHYDGVTRAVSGLLRSKEAQERTRGRFFADREYTNFSTALRLALRQQVSIRKPFVLLSHYLDVVHDEPRGLELADMVIEGLSAWPEEKLTGRLGLELIGAIDNAAKRYLLLKRYPEAEAGYKRALKMWTRAAEAEPEWRKLGSSIYHQLGIVAQEQRRWAEAEGYYKQALAIKVEFNDRHSQASTYHQLGRVAQEQRRWAEAEGYYKQALAIKVEFNDRYSQASTYHQLGRVAQEQRRWAEAEGYYKQALAIYVEFNDRLFAGLDLPPAGQGGGGAAAVGGGGGLLQAGAGDLCRVQRPAIRRPRPTTSWAWWRRSSGGGRRRRATTSRRWRSRSSSTTGIRRPRPTTSWAGWRRSSGGGRRRRATTSRRWRSYVEFNARYEQASTYHRLGIVAQEQRRWAEAEGYYKQALAIYVEFNARYEQASTYHQLGIVAQEQRRWAEAEGYYKQALAIYVEFNARYEQASTYHGLGIVAQEQRRWAEAEQYYRNDLELSKEFEDWHGVGITIGSIARLWRKSGGATIPTMVAGVLGVPQAEAEQLLKKALDGGEASNAES